uniref:Zn-dependent protease with chaperone function n=1 Tax=Rhodocyclus tenuis TaxID=1066 RepID=A0A840G587_RHOTE|nr:Zn-dependent protease with chaperone function [Rhodocyclus tenuis]
MTASLVQFAISRSREFEADRGGAEIAGGPAVLADALGIIEACARGISFLVAEAHPATAQMMISNPLRGASAVWSVRPRRLPNVSAVCARWPRGVATMAFFAMSALGASGAGRGGCFT